MGKKTKTGFFGKLLGGNKTESCCSVELEEVPEKGSNPKDETTVKHSEKSEKKNTGCGCGR